MGKRKFQTLSIVMPVYNEDKYLEDVVARVITQPLPAGMERELILVNDGSSDLSWRIMQKLPDKFPGIKFQLVNKPENEGKGAAVRDGFARVRGEIVIIQDADFEYDPADYPKLLQPILDDKADVVFGSRFIGEPHRVMYFWHQVANNALNLFSNMLTNLNLTDMEVCYKVFVREVSDKIKIKSPRFGVEPEITAKIARMRLSGRRLRIYETGISYSGRTYEEGKKIGWKDAVSAIIQIIRFRFMD
ncbi:MAG: glycosyl transferase [Deltaproteobacteria bacterium HGW-Deltaproteobacteria-13]|nr:MAG: glycosyl transferase [Deltaproteobacteria bacterium HGW-Deltaproteobacteria-13]